MKAVIGISNWSQTRGELRTLAKKIDAGKRPATDIGGGRCACPVLRPKLPSLWICQGG